MQKKTIRKKMSLPLLRTSFFAALVIFAFLQIPATAQENPTEENKVGDSGLALPRWASIKSANANARSGPGDTYPVKAVYKRAGLPVEIVAEFKLWREIVDIEGEHNWVHKALLSGTRHAILKSESFAYAAISSSKAVAKLEKDSQVRVDECNATYCQIHIENGITDIKGWVEKAKLWGVYPDEIFD